MCVALAMDKSIETKAGKGEVATIAQWYADAGRWPDLVDLGLTKAHMLRTKKQRNCPTFRSRIRVWFKIMNGELDKKQS